MSSASTTTAELVTVRDLRPPDWPEVAAIFADGIESGHATFELEPPTWESWDAAHGDIRVVAEVDGRIAGWAALAPVSERHCYRGVAEESVYVAAWAQGRGIGRVLLDEVIERSEAAGFWTLQAGIFPENAPSLRLHLACGFRLVGVRDRLGEAPSAAGGVSQPGAGGSADGASSGAWRHVLLLERRSEVVGA
jgi:L-amino acid N-acyltransferase YncA